MKKLLAIDPSVVKTGWCVFDIDSGSPIEWGIIRTKKNKELDRDQSVYDRMNQLATSCLKIKHAHNIDQVVIEDQFLLKNVKTLKTMVMAKAGVLMPFSSSPEKISTIPPKVWQCPILGEYDGDVKSISVESAKGYLDEYDIQVEGIILPEDTADAINIGRYWLSLK